MSVDHIEQFSGDVHLQRDGSVALRGAEDVYVHPEAVEGTLELRDPEYVYVDATAHSTASATAETAIAGDLEDGYVESVAGDVSIEDAEDVFVARDAADEVTIQGAEQIFQPDGTGIDPTTCDRLVSGWSQNRSIDSCEGLAVVGANNSVETTGIDGKSVETTGIDGKSVETTGIDGNSVETSGIDGNSVETTGIDVPADTTASTEGAVGLYVVGWNNEIRLEGTGSVRIQFVGRDNTVSLGPSLTAERAGTAGHENAIDQDPIPPEALIETPKSAAADAATIGRHRITWQEPTSDREYCPNCGADTATVIARRQRDAFFVLGVPVWTFDDGGRSFECPECSRLGPADTDLTEAERRSVLR